MLSKRVYHLQDLVSRVEPQRESEIWMGESETMKMLEKTGPFFVDDYCVHFFLAIH